MLPRESPERDYLEDYPVRRSPAHYAPGSSLCSASLILVRGVQPLRSAPLPIPSSWVTSFPQRQSAEIRDLLVLTHNQIPTRPNAVLRHYASLAGETPQASPTLVDPDDATSE